MRSALIFIFLFTRVSGAINSNGDFQYWEYHVFHKKFSDKVTLGLHNEFRFGNNAKQLWYIHEQFFLIYNLAHWVNLMPAYRHIQVRTANSSFKVVYDPLFDLNFHWKKKVEIVNRNRFHYFIHPIDKNPFLYRFLFVIGRAPYQEGFEFKPYISNEFFFRNRAGFNEDWLTTGFHLKFSKTFILHAYYRARFLKPDHWIYTNVIGLGAYFYF